MRCEPCILSGEVGIKKGPHSKGPTWDPFDPTAYLEAHEDLVSRLVMGIIGVIIWVMGVIDLLTKSPDSPSKPLNPTCSQWREA